jgi:alanine dehydrogenase
MGFQQVSPSELLAEQHSVPVFTQLKCEHYVARKDGKPFDKDNFYQYPNSYKSIFAPFYTKADIMVNGIYYDRNAPPFFTVEEMARPDFKLRAIADVSCDIAPDSSIPSTLRASTIANPVFGFDPTTGKETAPFRPDCVDMMTIDNLPNEMPRDASAAFGNQFLQHILPELCKGRSRVISHGTIAEDGRLTSHFKYLEDYANAKAERGVAA